MTAENHIHTCWACDLLFNCEREHALNAHPNPGSLGTCQRCRRLDHEGKLVEVLRTKFGA